MKLNLLLVLMAVMLQGCGTEARSSGTASGGQIKSNQPGYTCFIIRDENDTAVGGNCVKDY